MIPAWEAITRQHSPLWRTAMAREPFSPLCKSGPYVLLTCGRNTVIAARLIGPEMRRLCLAAALLYDSGRHRAAKTIFKWILKKHLPGYEYMKTLFFSTYRLALLAHALTFPEKNKLPVFTGTDFQNAVRRLYKNREK